VRRAVNMIAVSSFASAKRALTRDAL